MREVNLPGPTFLLSNNALLAIVRNCRYEYHKSAMEPLNQLCDQCAILYAERLEKVISDIEEMRTDE